MSRILLSEAVLIKKVFVVTNRYFIPIFPISKPWGLTTRIILHSSSNYYIQALKTRYFPLIWIEYLLTIYTDRTEDHHRETAIPCFAQKGFELHCPALQSFNLGQYLGKQPLVYRNLIHLECDISNMPENVIKD